MRARRLAILAGLCLAFRAAVAPGAAPKPTPAKSPHVEIVARAHVETPPRRTTHKNRRQFLEFEVSLDAFYVAAEQPAGADRNVEVDMKGRVKVVHDLSCGGEDLTLAVGDRVEITGEYVRLPDGTGLIHFTHPADARAGCGSGGGHPGGSLTRVVPKTPTPVVTAPHPGSTVPEQPYVGTPSTGPQPWLEILRLKEQGMSNDALLERVRAEGKVYALTTADMQRLRAGGVSPEVIEAMLRSRRTPTPRR